MTQALTMAERISEILTLISLQVDRYGPAVVGQDLAEGELIDFVAAKDAEIARLTAEVASLRPLADAYRAGHRWEQASEFGTAEECARAWDEYLAATRRAITFVPGATP